MSQASTPSTSDALRGQAIPSTQGHAFVGEPGYGTCRQLLGLGGESTHTWFCGHLPSHPVHQSDGSGQVLAEWRL